MTRSNRKNQVSVILDSNTFDTLFEIHYALDDFSFSLGCESIILKRNFKKVFFSTYCETFMFLTIFYCQKISICLVEMGLTRSLVMLPILFSTQKLAIALSYLLPV